MSTEFEHISLLPMQCGDNFDTEVSNTNFDPSAAGYQDFTSAPFSALPPLLRHADESNPGFTRTGKMCSDRLPAQAAQAPQPLWQQQRTDVRASGNRSQLIAGGSSAGPSVGGGLKRPLWDSTNTVTRGVTLRVEGTPTKTLTGSQLNPLTPTANLKLLFSAMSPEIRNRDSKKKKQLFDECSGDVAASVQEAAGDGGNEAVLEGCEGGAFIEDAIFKTSRKDKSLRLLCMRFLAMFPNDTSVQISMCLDKIAKQLCTERRRIYDIVNVLESVEIVSRQAKNQYSWHGRAQLTNTLLKLKELARRERYDRLLEAVLEYETRQDVSLMRTSLHESFPDISIETRDGLRNPHSVMASDAARRDKSLGILSQKFLMLFLVSESKAINLDTAAKILMGELITEKIDFSKYKTKVRRLYDIANILTSLDLIEKVQVSNGNGRKPGFKYVGPDPQGSPAAEVASVGDTMNRPSTRHSMLASVPHCNATSFTYTMQPSLAAARCSADQENVEPAVKKRRFSTIKMENMSSGAVGVNTVTNHTVPLSRHSSLKEICLVAEKEREKLQVSAGHGTQSAPSSPRSFTHSRTLVKGCLESGRVTADRGTIVVGARTTKNPIEILPSKLHTKKPSATSVCDLAAKQLRVASSGQKLTSSSSQPIYVLQTRPVAALQSLAVVVDGKSAAGMRCDTQHCIVLTNGARAGTLRPVVAGGNASAQRSTLGSDKGDAGDSYLIVQPVTQTYGGKVSAKTLRNGAASTAVVRARSQTTSLECGSTRLQGRTDAAIGASQQLQQGKPVRASLLLCSNQTRTPGTSGGDSTVPASVQLQNLVLKQQMTGAPRHSDTAQPSRTTGGGAVKLSSSSPSIAQAAPGADVKSEVSPALRVLSSLGSILLTELRQSEGVNIVTAVSTAAYKTKVKSEQSQSCSSSLRCESHTSVSCRASSYTGTPDVSQQTLAGQNWKGTPGLTSLPVPPGFTPAPVTSASTGSPQPVPVSVTILGPGPVPVSEPVPIPGPGSVPIPGPGPVPVSVHVPASVPIPGPGSVPVSVPVPIPGPGPVPVSVPVPIPGPGPVPVSVPVPIPGPVPVSFAGQISKHVQVSGPVPVNGVMQLDKDTNQVIIMLGDQGITYELQGLKGVKRVGVAGKNGASETVTDEQHAEENTSKKLGKVSRQLDLDQQLVNATSGKDEYSSSSPVREEASVAASQQQQQQQQQHPPGGGGIIIDHRINTDTIIAEITDYMEEAEETERLEKMARDEAIDFDCWSMAAASAAEQLTDMVDGTVGCSLPKDAYHSAVAATAPPVHGTWDGANIRKVEGILSCLSSEFRDGNSAHKRASDDFSAEAAEALPEQRRSEMQEELEELLSDISGSSTSHHMMDYDVDESIFVDSLSEELTPVKLHSSDRSPARNDGRAGRVTWHPGHEESPLYPTTPHTARTMHMAQVHRDADLEMTLGTPMKSGRFGKPFHACNAAQQAPSGGQKTMRRLESYVQPTTQGMSHVSKEQR